MIIIKDEKSNMLSAIRFWAIEQNMEEIFDDESYRYWTDIAFKKDDKIIGFITEFDRDDKLLMSKMVFSRDFCDYIYIVTDDSKKRTILNEKIMPEHGIWCYSNSFGLGMTYQILKTSSLIL